MDYFTGNTLSLCEITEIGNLEIVCRYIYRTLLKVKEGKNEIIYRVYTKEWCGFKS